MTPHTELRMRTDNSVGRTLYLQRGVEPSSLDDLIGLVDTPELAAKIVEAWNEYWPEPADPTQPSHVDEIKRKAVDLAQHDDRIVDAKITRIASHDELDAMRAAGWDVMQADSDQWFVGRDGQDGLTELANHDAAQTWLRLYRG